MKSSGLPRFAWVLAGLLLISAVAITLGKDDDNTSPVITSYGPSGTLAFADLLRSKGYRVEESLSSRPQLDRKDLVIGFYDQSQAQPIGTERDEDSPFHPIHKFLREGGKALLMPLPKDFRGASEVVAPLQVQRLAPGSKPIQLQARVNLTMDEPGQLLARSPVKASLFHTQSNMSFAMAGHIGTSTVVAIGDGIPATNRFIDQGQNAEVMLSVVKALAPPGSKIVFVNALFNGGEEPGLLEIIGPWAQLGGYQVLFLFVVMVFTLGKRFGLAEEPRSKERGQRELLDAIADTYRRTRSTSAACKACYDMADLKVRRALKLTSDAPVAERDDRLPGSLVSAFKQVFLGTIESVQSQDALLRCKTLDQEIEQFLATITVRR